MYNTPKALYENEKYKGLSLNVKMFYGILYTLAWEEPDGAIDNEPYLLGVNDRLAKICEISPKTAISYRKQLRDYGLIVERRQGLGEPNITIVKTPEPELREISVNDIEVNSKGDVHFLKALYVDLYNEKVRAKKEGRCSCDL